METAGHAWWPASDAKTLVYADFEKIENNRPVSTRGGLIQMFAYEESHTHKPTFKGMQGADPPAPGKRIRLQFFTPLSAEAVTVAAEVVWSTFEPEGAMGLRFLDVDDVTRSILRELMRRQMQKQR